MQDVKSRLEALSAQISLARAMDDDIKRLQTRIRIISRDEERSRSEDKLRSVIQALSGIAERAAEAQLETVQLLAAVSDQRIQRLLYTRYVQGLSIQDAAARCEISTATASRWIRRGIDSICSKLNPDDK